MGSDFLDFVYILHYSYIYDIYMKIYIYVIYIYDELNSSRAITYPSSQQG